MHISLSRPRRAAILEWFVAGSASCACYVAASFQALPFWLALVTTLVPLVICWREQGMIKSLTEDHLLLVNPHTPWLLQKIPLPRSHFGTKQDLRLSEETVFVSSLGSKATLVHYWHHFFGLTLALKIRNHPQNEDRNVKIMIWRSQLAPDVYRRLCVMANWRVHQLQKEQSLESV